MLLEKHTWKSGFVSVEEILAGAGGCWAESCWLLVTSTHKKIINNQLAVIFKVFINVKGQNQRKFCVMKDHKIWPWFIKLQNMPLSINLAVIVGKLRQGTTVLMHNSNGNGVWVVERSRPFLILCCVQSGRSNYYSVPQWCGSFPEKRVMLGQAAALGVRNSKARRSRCEFNSFHYKYAR